MSVFRTKFIAAIHVAAMLTHSRCFLDRAVACGGIVEPSSLTCPMCDDCEGYETLGELQRHISAHLLDEDSSH
eukprot:2403495-Heterocapsa_arctica.AAC.1